MDKKEVKLAVATLREQISTALDGENQAEDINEAVYNMLKSFNIQMP
ncbi:hypothetical protein ACNRWW_11775 [Metabacillus sp. HB246100]